MPCKEQSISAAKPANPQEREAVGNLAPASGDCLQSPDVSAYFDRLADGWANRYDRSYFLRLRRHQFNTALATYVPRAERAADFGCGSGPLTPLLARLATRVDAVDASLGMAAVARVRLREFANVEVSSGESLPGQDYDVIICSSVIEYVVHDTELLGHFADALKPSGILLVSFPNRRGLLQSITWMFSKRSEYLKYRSRTYTIGEVRALMATRFELLDAKTSIGLPILRNLGAGELILAVGRKR